MIDFTIDPEDRNRIRKALDSMTAKDADSSLRKAIQRANVYVLKVLQFEVSGVSLNVRTGNLLRSMGMRTTQLNDAIVGTVGSGASSEDPILSQGGKDVDVDDSFRMMYADILEDGGTITPTNSKFLAIPIGEALTGAGVARFSPAELQQGAGGFQSSVLIFPYIFGVSVGAKSGKLNRLTPLFKLVSSVYIPPKHYLSNTVEATESGAVQIMVEEVEKGLNKK
jgi:hypothetical protein